MIFFKLRYMQLYIYVYFRCRFFVDRQGYKFVREVDRFRDVLVFFGVFYWLFL